MSPDTVALVGFLSLFAMMLLRVPVGMAMGLVGVAGFGAVVGTRPALALIVYGSALKLFVFAALVVKMLKTGSQGS